MSSASTNKKKTTPLHLLPQANLHVKILDLVSNRINPYKEDVHLQHGDCSTCITTSKKSPHRMSATMKQNNSKKKVASLKTQYPTQAGTNFTTHNNSFYEHPRPSLPYIKSPVLMKQTKSSLSIDSKVMSISIDSAKLADLTIDLRGQIQPEFVSSKFLCKLKLQIIEKQQRIKQLQKELQLKEYHIQQLHKDMQEIIDIHKKQAYSDNHLINNDALSDVKNQPSSLKQIFLIQRRSSAERSNSRIQEYKQDFTGNNNDYEYLLRIIKTQARELQSMYNIDYYSKGRRSLSKNS